ncbi:MAG: hypothetical protein LBO00_03790 [Zoogloeaceae bacterium]|jgi:hypothetical protein|nr:hypothetical protein [Zoogloeaceae bacterium]
MKQKLAACLLFAACLWAFSASAADESANIPANVSANPPADLGRIIQETQQQRARPDHFRMVWWMPSHFWAAVLHNVPVDPQEALALLDTHTIVAVIDAKLPSSGAPVFTPRRELAESLVLQVDRQGEWLAPLEEEVQTDGVRIFLATLREYLARQFGRLGGGFEFFLFPNRNLHNEIILSPRHNQWLSIRLQDETFLWRLPPASFFPDRQDAETGETFPGNYRFNPYTGKALASP